MEPAQGAGSSAVGELERQLVDADGRGDSRAQSAIAEQLVRRVVALASTAALAADAAPTVPSPRCRQAPRPRSADRQRLLSPQRPPAATPHIRRCSPRASPLSISAYSPRLAMRARCTPSPLQLRLPRAESSNSCYSQDSFELDSVRTSIADSSRGAGTPRSLPSTPSELSRAYAEGGGLDELLAEAFKMHQFGNSGERPDAAGAAAVSEPVPNRPSWSFRDKEVAGD